MAQEHSFDIVSKVDLQEVRNALQQTRKELTTRFDLKGRKTDFELDAEQLVVTAEDDHHLKSVLDILQIKLVKRQIPLKALVFDKAQDASLGSRRQTIRFQQGIPIEKAREVVKIIKKTKLKVQAAIQGDQVRVSAKKIDELQQIMGLLKDDDGLDIHMEFVNYR